MAGRSAALHTTAFSAQSGGALTSEGYTEWATNLEHVQTLDSSIDTISDNDDEEKALIPSSASTLESSKSIVPSSSPESAAKIAQALSPPQAARAQASKRKLRLSAKASSSGKRGTFSTPRNPQETSPGGEFNDRLSSSPAARQRPVSRWVAGVVSSVWSCLGSSEVGRELQVLLPMAAPIMAGSCLNQLLNIVDLMFVGNFLGPEYLAAAALGNCWFNLLSALFLGGSSGMDELCSEVMTGKRVQGGGEGGSSDRGEVGAGGSVRKGRGHTLPTVLATSTPYSDPTLDAAITVLSLRGVVVMVLASFVIMIGLLGTENFLVVFGGQDKELAETAAGFCDSLIIGLLPLAVSTALGRYLAVRGLVWPGITVDLIANFINITLNAALIEVDGFLGAPLATSVSRWGHVCMIGGYILLRRPPRFTAVASPARTTSTESDSADKIGDESPMGDLQQATDPSTQSVPPAQLPTSPSSMLNTITSLSAPKAGGSNSLLTTQSSGVSSRNAALMIIEKNWHDLEGLGSMCFAMASGAFVVALESWPMELSNLLAGKLDVPSLDAHTVVFNTCVFISLGLPMGLGVAASARIPELLSQGDAIGARTSAMIAILSSVTYNLAAALALLALRGLIGVVFTPSPEVATLCANTALLAALYQLCDGTTCVVGGVLRGLGWGNILTWIIFFVCCAVGLPLGAALAFKAGGDGWGVFGLWLGLLTSALVTALAFFAIYRSIDWDVEAKRALEMRRRVESSM